MTDILAVFAAIAVVACLGVALYGWFTLSLRRFHVVAAKDVLFRWDAELAQLSEQERDQQRLQPPVDVLEAAVALPSPRIRVLSER